MDRLTLPLAFHQLAQEVDRDRLVAAQVCANFHAQEVKNLLLRGHDCSDALGRDLLCTRLGEHIALHLNLKLTLCD